MLRSQIRPVIVHHAEHVRLTCAVAARSSAQPTLLTPPGAAAYAGVAYLKQLAGNAQGLEAIIDCGDDAGLAMAAIRVGWRDLHLDGDPEILAKVDNMLGQVGGHLHRTLPPALDLGTAADPKAELMAWLDA